MAETEGGNQVETADSGVSLLDRIVGEGKLALDDSQKEHARDLLAEFVGQVVGESGKVSGDVVEAINLRIAQIDELISAQLNEVLHNPAFQKLEATWRGLHY